jgi:hypothetical protein
MLAIADAIESAGATVRMAGGGAGTEFVSLNGYDEFEPTNVDYIDTFQDGSTWQTVSQSLPASLGRIADYQAWLAETEPDALVTDDMFAAMAARRCDVPQYVLKHDMPGLYDDPIERAGAGFHTRFQLSAAREFFYPVVWPGSDVDPASATRIPPVALDGEEQVADGPDVVVVPSHYSSLSRIADHLDRQGYDVLDVASEDWDPVASLLPYIRSADVVVCSGYSTIMDAAVAGTPCVVHPATDEQDAVADCLERFDVAGFTVAENPLDVLDAVADPPAEPTFENGADYIARRVVTDLRDPDPYTTQEPESEPATDEASVAGTVGTLTAVPTLAAVCATTATSTFGPSRLVRSIGGTLARVGRGCRFVADRIASGLVDGVNYSARRFPDRPDATVGVGSSVVDRCRGSLATCRRGGASVVTACRSATEGLLDRCRSGSLVPSLRS